MSTKHNVNGVHSDSPHNTDSQIMQSLFCVCDMWLPHYGHITSHLSGQEKEV